MKARIFLTNESARSADSNGRHLSDWVAMQGHDSGSPVSGRDYHDSDEAIYKTGTNAFPFLLKWIQHEDKNYRYTLLRPLKRMFSNGRFNDLITSPAQARAEGAAEALRMLRTNFGSTTIVELTRLANNPAARQTAERATRVLACAGREGLHSLAIMLQDPRHPNRHFAYFRLMELYMNHELTPDANICGPGLIQYITNTNPPANAMWKVIPYASEILTNLNVIPEAYVATLTTNLHHSDPSVRLCSAVTLPRFGNDAAPAVHALTALLFDSDRDVRIAVTNALRQISPGLITNAPAH